MEQTSSPFMTPAQVSALTLVPTGTLRYWRHVGRGPQFVKLPGSTRVLYRRSDVDAWLAASRTCGPAPSGNVA